MVQKAQQRQVLVCGHVVKGVSCCMDCAQNAVSRLSMARQLMVAAMWPTAACYLCCCALCCALQERLVAMGGKLVTLKSQAGEAPNGEAAAAAVPLPHALWQSMDVSSSCSCWHAGHWRFTTCASAELALASCSFVPPPYACILGAAHPYAWILLHICLQARPL
jgi:hypothetical protein